MDIQEIKDMPTVIDRNHESLFRSYQTLQLVKEMLRRGDSVKTISEVIEHIEAKRPLDEN